MLKQQLNLLSQNLCIYYSHLVDDIYQRLMDKAQAAGYHGLKLSHALILLQISNHGTRIIDIARSQAVSKQAIGQIAIELEALSLIKKATDKNDKRAKLLQMTEQGIKLVRLAASFLQQVDAEIAASIGADYFAQLQSLSFQLFKQLHLAYPSVGEYALDISKTPLIAHASAIATHLDIELKQRIGQQGHPSLKRSYWHILEKITQNGVSVNDLAAMNGISKQAISQLANDIEKEGYIQRTDNPNDKRSKQLTLSNKGILLIQHTLEAVQAIELSLQQLLGTAAISQLKMIFAHYIQCTLSLECTNFEQQIQLALKTVFQAYPNNHWLENNQLNALAIQHLKQMQF